jgi:hypothetical protein
MNLYKLLEDKNYWYSKYLAGNEAFLQALRHAPEVALEELELFHGNRDSLLNIIDNLEEKIQQELLEQNWKGDLTTEQTTRIQYFIREKDSMIRRIVELDSEILELMESIRSEGLEKIRLLAKGKKALAKYKSALNYNDKIDKRI